MTDIWHYWREALAGKAPPIDANSPQCGFYRKRDGKGGAWVPVMIRYDDAGALRCRVGSDSNADPHDVWTWCANHPISKDDARHAFEHGSFPGDAPAAGNAGDVPLADQINDYAATALDWLNKTGISDKSSSDMAANFRAELLRLGKEADRQRDAEKRPHDEAAKAVQAKWRPVIDAAQSAADAIRAALTRWMTAEEKRQAADRQAKWEAEKRAADAARKAVEEQRAKMMRDDPIAAITSPEPEMPSLPPPPDPVKVNAGGQRGRATGLRTVTKYVVADHAKALAFFAESEDVRSLIQKLAERASKAGVDVPGVVKQTEKVAA